MVVPSPVEETLPTTALSSSQVQQLIRTNEALQETNKSLKEMVISVIELLRDPARNVTYGEALRNPELRIDTQQMRTSPLSPSSLRHPTSPSASARVLSSGSLAQGSTHEGSKGMLLGESVCPMTFEQIDAETAMYRQRYKGGDFSNIRFKIVIMRSLYSEVLAYCA